MNDNQKIINLFPGRWLGGITMILGPLLLLIGVTSRFQFNFFFPQQLEAFHENPTLLTLSYSSFLAGNILMWPAIITLINLISIKSPRFALWGGIFAIFGLFARTFHAGIDHLAFQIVRFENIDLATEIVANSYGAFHIIRALNLYIMVGWIILAIGVYRSKIMNIFNSIAFGLMAALPLGVLKGTTTFSIIATIGLCVALIPLGVRVIMSESMPSLKTGIRTFVLISLLLLIFTFVGFMG
jgi:hypothetical protein